MQFRFYPLRFEFTAKESLFFPPGKAANILRGALGVIFRRIACVPHCESAKSCELRGDCPYARVFEPTALSTGPSGLADWPRPFVFRAHHLDGRIVQPAESFHFDLNVFTLDHNVLAYFVLTFASLAGEGLGPRRGKADLTRVTSGGQILYESSTRTISGAVQPASLSLDPPPDPVNRIRVRFVTPVELKHEHKIALRPEFSILFGRIRDRIATLSRLYGGVELPIDYRGTNERSTAVAMTAYSGRRREDHRRSSKTGHSHSIGGFVGEAEYEGNLSEFLPFLEAARWTGVGRQSVWGKGEIEVSVG
ncbi:MAG: CRISPR system precrRNA processing endoribonuclease RAMP protein Cas6 [Acidobacteriota bacterium]|nr:CRISPR system precrRNA processing endoribonuclease RAMP protein Cas6 [Acidobacteriota bacterium]